MDALTAVEAILSKKNREAITIVNDDDKELCFSQVATISFDDKTYCILKPLNNIEGDNNDFTLLFNIDKNNKLKLVEDAEINNEVYSKYYQLRSNTLEINSKKDLSCIKDSTIYAGKFLTDFGQYNNAKMLEITNLLQGMNEAFKKLQGQNHVIQAVKDELISIRDIPNKSGPLGLFTFMGAPGVGKTMLSQLLAEYLNIPYKRLDMSQYGDKESSLDFIGLNPSYKTSTPGDFTSFAYAHPYGLVVLDEIEKAHPNVLRTLLQILERGSVRDNSMKVDISVRNLIIIITTNVGCNIYNESIGKNNFSNVPLQVLIDALKTEKSPITGERFFSDALVSRFSSGKIILFNKLTPIDVYKIIREEMKAYIKKTESIYRVPLHLDEDILTRYIVYSLGENIDVRSALQKLKGFFNLINTRLSEIVIENDRSGFVKSINVVLDLDKESIDVQKTINKEDTFRLLVYTKDKEILNKKILNNKDIEIISVDNTFDFSKIRSLDISASIIDIGDGNDGFSISLFDSINEEENCPAFMFSSTGLSKSYFQYYNDKGAADIYCKNKTQSFDDWLSSICVGLRLNSVYSDLSKTNHYFKYEFSFDYEPNDHLMYIKILNAKIAVAISSNDNIFSTKREIPVESFSDVIGGKKVNDELLDVAEYLKNYKKYKRVGIRIPRGILLYGKPGTGKTMRAKALAHEANLPFIEVNATECLQGNIGEGAKYIKNLFATARKYGGIIFIDEFDQIAKRRDLEFGYSEYTNALLSEMDGFSTSELNPVIVIAATNFSAMKGESVLDEAVLRRFDRKIKIELPTEDERELYLKNKLKKMNIETVSLSAIHGIAQRSIGWNLAELDLVVENAIKTQIRETGNLMLCDKVLEEEFEYYQYGETKKIPEDKLKKIAVHEVGHAFVCASLGQTPTYITVTGRANFGGYVYFGNEEKTEFSKKEIEDRICCALAGRAAEIVFYNEDGITTGASSDIKEATKMAKSMICDYAMDEDVMFNLEYNDKTAELVNLKINAIMQNQMLRAKDLISKNEQTFTKIVDLLVEKKNLYGEELKDFFKNE